MQVIAAIHWEALFLWLRGAGYRRKPEPPSRVFSIAYEAQALASTLRIDDLAQDPTAASQTAVRSPMNIQVP
jgi:hypothetical protein